MSNPQPLLTPLLNANEDFAVLASIEVSEGQLVSKGDVLAVFETTKSSQELFAEKDGRILGLTVKPGDNLKAGDVWAYLADPHEKLENITLSNTPHIPQSGNLQTPDPLTRFTNSAQILAVQHGLQQSDFATEGIITEQMVRAFLSSKNTPQPTLAWVKHPASVSKKLIIYGAGGHGRTLAEMIKLLPSYEIIGFVDDGVPTQTMYLDYPVLGGKSTLKDLFSDGICLAINGVGGISSITQRIEAYQALRDAGFFCPTVVHPFAFIEASAQLFNGVQVFPFAYVGSQVQLGYGTIVNTSAIISHDCVLGEMVNLSPGATLAGSVIVGDHTLIGMRVTVNLGVKIGANVRIGNGATVKSDVPPNGIVPAGSVYPLR